VVISAPAAWL
jgi:hypothetical protein